MQHKNDMIAWTSKKFRTKWLTCFFIIAATNVIRCEPYIPQAGSNVLEKIRATAFDPAAHGMRELRARLTANPGNLSLACQFARLCIERSRSEADPRFLGRAQS